MAYKLTIDMPNLGPDDKVAIMGLGEFQNGKSYKIDDEQHEMFRAMTATIEDKFDDKGRLVSRETVPGQPLDELEMYGVQVEVLKDEAPKPAQEPAKPKEGDK